MAWTAPKTYTVGELLTAADMNLYQRDNLEAGFPYGTTTQTYTPTLTAGTNPTLGSGATQQGAYYRVGRTVFVWARIRFGTSGTAAGSGTYSFSLPVNADTTNLNATTNTTASTVGEGHVRDNSTSGNSQPVAVLLGSTSTVVMLLQSGSLITEAIPFAWDASDQIAIQVSYPAA